ncbi:MAG: hypothetical protein WCT14_18690 [Treponemataceae bacterium]
MKRFGFSLLTFLLSVGIATSQVVVEGNRYEIKSDLGETESRALAKEMDRRFELYNGLFRFDPKRLPGKLKVRAFAEKEAYDAYLKTSLGETRENACYLHYSRFDRSELVVLKKDGGFFSHQAFIQFLRAFVPQPPLWIREGFAVVFEPLVYDSGRDSFSFEENLAWLETVKRWGVEAPSLAGILLSDENESINAEKLVPAAWAIASFLLNVDDEEYRRFLYEAFLLLKPELASGDNARLIADRGAVWIDLLRAQTDIESYLKSRRTFAELIEDGRAAYAAKNPKAAEKAFLAAAELKSSHYAPQYYLGLLAYEKKEYEVAEKRYKNALENGADEALCSFALGVNAAAAGKASEAREFLERAKTVAPSRYAVKVDELLVKLR